MACPEARMAALRRSGRGGRRLASGSTFSALVSQEEIKRSDQAAAHDHIRRCSTVPTYARRPDILLLHLICLLDTRLNVSCSAFLGAPPPPANRPALVGALRSRRCLAADRIARFFLQFLRNSCETNAGAERSNASVGGRRRLSHSRSGSENLL